MRRREEEARRCYSSSPMSDPMLESKLKKLVPSVILLQRQLISQLDGNVIRNTFYDNEPKYLSLIHPYSSQYEIGISQFLSQIVALKAFEDTSYLNLLSPMQKKNQKHYLFQFILIHHFPATHALCFILTHASGILVYLWPSHSVGTEPHMIVQVCRSDQSSQHTDTTG